jgi:rSAM/selenodomain-associated transferase 1
MDRTLALIFTRYPSPGSVKTRMTPPLTAIQAAALHLAALRAVCETVLSVGDLSLRVMVTPDEQCETLREMLGRHPTCNPRASESSIDQRAVPSGDRVRAEEPRREPTAVGDPAWTLPEVCPQGDGDLGDRLARATKRAFDEGASGVVLVGADSPTMPATFLAQARAELQNHDLALGPASDGGYYLLAVQSFLPALFANIEWGGPDVLEQTRRRIRELRLTVFELPVWYDLDRFDDLSLARSDLALGHTAQLAFRGAAGGTAFAGTSSRDVGIADVNPVNTAAQELHTLIDQLLAEYAQ